MIQAATKEPEFERFILADGRADGASSALFPKSHDRERVDDRRLLSGIIFVNRNRLRWRDASREYGPAKTLYYRWKRWSDKGIFIRMMEGLATPQAPDHKQEQALGQHSVAVASAFTALDPEQHPLTVDVADLERRHLCNAQAGAIGDRQA